MSEHEPQLADWLAKGYHGEMDYMARHGMMRARPHELLPGTLRVISVRMNYLPEQAAIAHVLSDPDKGYISRYALGRDYHKVLRNRLKKLADKIAERAELLVARLLELFTWHEAHFLHVNGGSPIRRIGHRR